MKWIKQSIFQTKQTTEEIGTNDLITIFQQHYNPALSTSSMPPSTQTHHIVPSPSPVNIHIINSNHHHHQLQQTPPPPHQTVATHHTAIQGQPQLIQHHIIPQQHHIIYQQPLQQLQQQPQYHPMYHIIKQENDRSWRYRYPPPSSVATLPQSTSSTDN